MITLPSLLLSFRSKNHSKQTLLLCTKQPASGQAAFFIFITLGRYFKVELKQKKTKNREQDVTRPCAASGRGRVSERGREVSGVRRDLGQVQ